MGRHREKCRACILIVWWRIVEQYGVILEIPRDMQSVGANMHGGYRRCGAVGRLRNVEIVFSIAVLEHRPLEQGLVLW